jgi:peptidyl-prolyl cis-trans isomerase SurA
MHSKLAFLLLLAFLLPLSVDAVIIDKIAAIVDDDVITHSEVYASERLNFDFSGLPKEESALEDRINFHLVLQQLQNQPPVTITQDEMDKAIQPFVESNGGIEKFTEFLSSIGMNYEDFKTEVRNQISIRKFIADRFRPFVNITLSDAQKYYKEVYVPIFEILGKQPPTFPESFEEIQVQMVESQVQDRIQEWLKEMRQKANITIKD